MQSSLHIIVDEAHNILSNTSIRESEEWKDYRLECFEEIIKEGRKTIKRLIGDFTDNDSVPAEVIAKEKEIREGILRDKQDILYAIINLPPDLFYGTTIPTCLLVISKKEKPEKLKGKVLIINADAEYGEGKNQNYLRPEDTEKIVWVFESLQKRMYTCSAF